MVWFKITIRWSVQTWPRENLTFYIPFLTLSSCQNQNLIILTVSVQICNTPLDASWGVWIYSSCRSVYLSITILRGFREPGGSIQICFDIFCLFIFCMFYTIPFNFFFLFIIFNDFLWNLFLVEIIIFIVARTRFGQFCLSRHH